MALSIAMAMGVYAQDLGALLRAVERRYNSAQTLELDFEQKYLAPGRATRVEAGQLALRKPGRMRWQYSVPAGKLFLSDGKWIWFYSPQARRAEKTRLRETDDFRAPLAFLLGRLDFRKEFEDLELKDANGASVVTGLPKREGLPYSRVEFLIENSRIGGLRVEGQDHSIMEFRFTNERLNPALAESLFRYTPPPGVETVEVRSLSGSEERD